MKLLEGQSDHVAAFVAMQIPECFPLPSEIHPFGPCDGIGLLREGRLIGGMVFYNWNLRAARCEIAAACVHPQGLTPRLIGKMLARPFAAHGIQKIVSFVAIENERSIENTLRMGFVREAMIPNHYTLGRHAQMSALYRKQWEESYGRFS